MRSAILIASVLGVFGFGYFLMGQLDLFLNESRESLKQEKERKEPSCIVFTEDMQDEELIREIRAFRSTHENMRIMLYDQTDAEGSSPKSDIYGRKK